MGHELRDDPSGVVWAKRRVRPNAVSLGGAVIPIQLATALEIIWARPHVRHAAQGDELLEISRNELWAII